MYSYAMGNTQIMTPSNHTQLVADERKIKNSRSSSGEGNDNDNQLFGKFDTVTGITNEAPEKHGAFTEKEVKNQKTTTGLVVTDKGVAQNTGVDTKNMSDFLGFNQSMPSDNKPYYDGKEFTIKQPRRGREGNLLIADQQKKDLGIKEYEASGRSSLYTVDTQPDVFFTKTQYDTAIKLSEFIEKNGIEGKSYTIKEATDEAFKRVRMGTASQPIITNRAAEVNQLIDNTRKNYNINPEVSNQEVLDYIKKIDNAARLQLDKFIFSGGETLTDTKNSLMSIYDNISHDVGSPGYIVLDENKNIKTSGSDYRKVRDNFRIRKNIQSTSIYTGGKSVAGPAYRVTDEDGKSVGYVITPPSENYKTMFANIDYYSQTVLKHDFKKGPIPAGNLPLPMYNYSNEGPTIIQKFNAIMPNEEGTDFDIYIGDWVYSLSELINTNLYLNLSGHITRTNRSTPGWGQKEVNSVPYTMNN
jgi:hypothetical protein